ncbi:hypothetical protein PHMEG_00014048 [Phytophthora megakarya]|uniref:Uncharacterized protein n=1 Tax=Phytophthora megakarya TaxID=4795 RepID=A0A225W5U3_9STRA|nr:hypothetical protein PHMEG_00014048 [Phytophthora megakarya]
MSVMNRLRVALTETSQLLENYEREQQEPNVETYRHCCRRFLGYLSIHMDTSPGFVEQMEHVIQLSHNGADGLALRSQVTRELWMRYIPRDDTVVIPSTPPLAHLEHKKTKFYCSTQFLYGVATKAPFTFFSTFVPSSWRSPHVELRISAQATAVRGAKRQSKRGVIPPQNAKRVRHTVVRNLYDAGRLDDEEKEDCEPESAKESLHVVYNSRDPLNPYRKSTSCLEREMKMLEGTCTKLEDSVAFHKEREHAIWMTSLPLERLDR